MTFSSPEPMSSISQDPGLDRIALQLGAGQVALDDLRHRGLEAPAEGGVDSVALEQLEQAPLQPQADPGEDVLSLAAWDGIGAGQRVLPSDVALEQSLAGLDLPVAADRGVDAVLEAFG